MITRYDIFVGPQRDAASQWATRRLEGDALDTAARLAINWPNHYVEVRAVRDDGKWFTRMLVYPRGIGGAWRVEEDATDSGTQESILRG